MATTAFIGPLLMSLALAPQAFQPAVLQTNTIPGVSVAAVGGGEVLVEANGSVGAVKVFRSAPAFDSAATDAVRQWRFRPAVVRGRAVPTFVYVMFGFPAPIGGK